MSSMTEGAAGCLVVVVGCGSVAGQVSASVRLEHAAAGELAASWRRR